MSNLFAPICLRSKSNRKMFRAVKFLHFDWSNIPVKIVYCTDLQLNSIFQQIHVFAGEIRFWCNIFSNNNKMNNRLWNRRQSLVRQGLSKPPRVEAETNRWSLFSREMKDSSGIYKTQHQGLKSVTQQKKRHILEIYFRSF